VVETPAPPETDTTIPSIPIPVPISYDELRRRAIQGESVGAQAVCPRCETVGELHYTSVWVGRGSYWAVFGGVEHRSTPVPLCRCGACGSRLRVLPAEIAAFKHYTLAVIETVCSAYTDAQLPEITLRRAVARMGPGHADHSTLHGWLAGLGERVWGRWDTPAGNLPVSALIAETARHLDFQSSEWCNQGHPVADRKYRTEKRREQLEGCARVFATAAFLFPATAHPFCAWELWLQERLNVTAWSFPARWRCTSFQQHLSGEVEVRSAANQRKPRGEERNRNHGARSPPRSVLAL
jgi:hypothetical protein